MTQHRAILAIVLTFALASPAAAGEAWRIIDSAGAIRAGSSGFAKIAISPNAALPENAWVETGPNGRLVLQRGDETIVLGPKSRVALPAQEVNGNTQILQSLGGALYHIGKQQRPHFQVDTPYLAAIVKGTTFTVTIADGVSSVAVEEGLVEVATPDRADVEFVRPGFTGSVSRDRDSVAVTRTSVTLPSPAAPSTAKTQRSAAATMPTRVVIASAIGETAIDVGKTSNGLAWPPKAQDAVAETDKSKDKDASASSALSNTTTNAGGGNANNTAPNLSGGSTTPPGNANNSSGNSGNGNGSSGGNGNSGGGNGNGNGNAGSGGSGNGGGNGNGNANGHGKKD